VGVRGCFRLVGDGPRCGRLQHYKPKKGEKRLSPRKGEFTTRSRIVVVFAGILVLMAVVASLSIGAAVKQYQATGAVTDVDAKGKTLSVDKGGEIWQFSTEGLKDMKAKKGDKVTVYYQMIAKKVEMK
jgi:hypothetical protein